MKGSLKCAKMLINFNGMQNQKRTARAIEDCFLYEEKNTESEILSCSLFLHEHQVCNTLFYGIINWVLIDCIITKNGACSKRIIRIIFTHSLNSLEFSSMREEVYTLLLQSGIKSFSIKHFRAT